MWNIRYDMGEYVFGTEPNKFLAGVVTRIPAGKILCPGEVEGRNAVYLAEFGCEILLELKTGGPPTEDLMMSMVSLQEERNGLVFMHAV